MLCKALAKGEGEHKVQYWLDAGASADAGFVCAVQSGNISLVRMLLDAGADPTDGTALWYAVDEGSIFSTSVPIIRLLIEVGANVNMQLYDETPLIRAAYEEVPAIVELLVAVGACLDHQSQENGETALIAAAAHGDCEIVRILLKAGAHPGIKNIDGDTAYRCAVRAGYDEIAQLITLYNER